MSAALAQLDAENLGTFCESNDDLQVAVSGSLKRSVKQLYEGEWLFGHSLSYAHYGAYPRVW